MNEKRTAADVLHDISRLSAEAEWTDEELNEALREEGIDPEELVRGVRARLIKAGCDIPALRCECRKWPSFEGPVDGVTLHHSLCDKGGRVSAYLN